MSRHTAHSHARRWPLWVGGGTGVVLLLAGMAVAAAWLFGRPHVSLARSSQALAEVRLGGIGTELTAVHATVDGRHLALVHRSGGVVPDVRVAQGEAVRLQATATPPSWLRWLLGDGVSTTATVRTPAAAAPERVALASRPGRVTVSFDHPVSVVDYQETGGPLRTLHLSRPNTLAHVTVPTTATAGWLHVAAAPRSWETVAPERATVTWFVPPADGEPVALSDPAPRSVTATPNGPVTLTFDQPVTNVLGRTRPTLSPRVAGTWSEPDRDTLVFTPKGFGFGPGTTVTVTFDRSVSVQAGTTSPGAVTTAASKSYQFTTAPGSVLRLEQILAQLHYLPLDFTPAAGATNPTTFAGEVDTVSAPLAGTFSWRWADTPSSLQALWSPGSAGVMLKSALMAFDAATQADYDGYQVDYETVDQLADAATWKALLTAAARGEVDPEPYSYVYVTEATPEQLSLWENGAVVLTSPANTGIAQDPTATGTYPIYVRYVVNTMKGTNPDGTPYDDIVHWINYFNGGDAVHGFDRATYGSAQSLGCVELPEATAETAFGDLAIGDLVTIVA